MGRPETPPPLDGRLRSCRPGATTPRVLLVDDDDLVRRAIARSLRRRYAVVEVREAERALELVQSGERFDAILCDLHLAGMSGRELLMRLAAERRDEANRLVIMSGSPRTALDEALLELVSKRFIEKPATLAAIDAVLRELLAPTTTAHAA